MRRMVFAWLVLAAVGCFATDAQELDTEVQSASRTETVEDPAAAAENPVPRNASPRPGPGAFEGASRGAATRPPAAAGAAPNRTSGPLKRIDTKPLSANANIALPQDI